MQIFENYGKCEKINRYETCYNRKKKELLNIRIKLSCHNILHRILMYEYWYDYVKPKYDERVTLCYMDTDRFILYVKT